MKVALVYDRVNKWGGAERVLLALHQLFPDAPLYTSVYNPSAAPWADTFTVKASFLQNIPFFRNKHELLPFLMPLAFESFNFNSYDLVISVTSESAKGIITKPDTKHICYCLTPTRYLWSGYKEYFTNTYFRLATRTVVQALRKWDVVASQRPDAFIAISKEVQRRIKKYYNRESIVVYPPNEISNFKFQTPNSKLNQNSGKYFLVVSRLVSYKRIDLAIQACNRLNLPLKIIGVGSQEAKLKALAGPTIEFIGRVSDQELVTYYQQSRALIFPGYEDFGLTIVEAQLFGIPVIAYKAGGATEIIKDDVTGIFFQNQSVDSLIEGIRAFENKQFDNEKIKANVSRFSMDTFKRSFKKQVDLVMKRQ